MRISKRQLRRIIKEEKRNLLNEVTPSEREEARRLSRLDTLNFDDPDPREMKTEDEWYDDIMNFIDQDMSARNVDMRDEESYELIKALESLRRTLTDEKRGSTR